MSLSINKPSVQETSINSWSEITLAAANSACWESLRAVTLRHVLFDVKEIIFIVFFQDYTAIPKAVSFSPKVVPTPSLRSMDVQNELDTAVDREQTIETDAIEFVSEPGKIYVVLGDSIEGYYFVKCLLSSYDSFKGKYLSVCRGEGDSETIVLKENRETDCFEYESVVSEVFCVTEVTSKKMFVINKEQLNDILVTIGEMVDI